MKKRAMIIVSIAVIVLVISAVWFNAPIDLMNINSNEVSEIVVFNGNTGKETRITDESQIENIVNNLNDIKMKRRKPSVGYMGYSFNMTIYLSSGKKAGGWNDFIINSSDTIRKDPFFYTIVEGSIDYDYIASIVD